MITIAVVVGRKHHGALQRLLAQGCMLHRNACQVLACETRGCQCAAFKLRTVRELRPANGLSYLVQDQQKSLPHLVKPHDTLRLGVRNLKDQASVSHPVEAIQEQVAKPTSEVTLSKRQFRALTASYLFVCSIPCSRIS